MAIPDDYKEMIATLTSATRERRVKWVVNLAGIEFSAAQSKCELWTGSQNDGSNYVLFALTDQDGEALDAWDVEEDEAEYGAMLGLYSEGKRQALNIPHRLAKIRDEIKRAAMINDEHCPPSAPSRDTTAPDCDASLPSAVTMR